MATTVKDIKKANKRMSRRRALALALLALDDAVSNAGDQLPELTAAKTCISRMLKAERERQRVLR